MLPIAKMCYCKKKKTSSAGGGEESSKEDGRERKGDMITSEQRSEGSGGRHRQSGSHIKSSKLGHKRQT